MDRLHQVAEIRHTPGEKIRLPNGPYIGKLVNSIAYFPVKRSRHFYRNWASWTQDARVIRSLKGRAAHIIFDDSELGEAWTIGFDEFCAHSRPTVNRTGTKLAVAERYWHRAVELPPDPQPTLFDLRTISPSAGATL